jgi:hypothetical protein
MYIAVVKQPACYNVIAVHDAFTKERLLQSTGAECVSFAQGFVAGVASLGGFVAWIVMEADAGDAIELEWRKPTI